MLLKTCVCKSFIYLLVIICVLILLLNVYLNNVDITHGHGDIDQVPETSVEEAEPRLVELDGSRPWYMHGGTRWPKPGRHTARLWPQPEDPWSDRIISQLMFVPPTYSKDEKIKKILIYNGVKPFEGRAKIGRDTFKENRCPVDTCSITVDKNEAADVDAIIFRDRFVKPGHTRSPRQVWIVFFMECPTRTKHLKYDGINWTATYRRDSDIVRPYARWVYYDTHVIQNYQLDKNYAANKTKKVAWFVSNCWATNGRLEYAHELQKHISVDIYGRCGNKTCPRTNETECFEILEKDYKFYLAFENSNCKDYITEKLFLNSLRHDVLPVVMGARPEDYAHSAPYHSYIHVEEFDSPAELAAYLHRLDKDDDLYNSYFRWKGTGEFIDINFFCRLCSMLHNDFPIKIYPDVNQWWRESGICTYKPWRKTKI